MKYLRLFILLLFSLGENPAWADNNPAQYVNPFIGTQGDGNTFPGATLPFGMVKLGPDCDDLLSNMGYRAEGKVHGFSHLHVSGTGGGSKYGNILVSPFLGETPAEEYGHVRDAEHAEVGYFSTEMDGHSLLAELTTTHKTGLHRYTFRKQGKGGILIDAGSLLGANACCGEEQILIGSEIEILSDTEMAGYSRVSGGWNKGRAFTVYFYASCNVPAQACGTWKSGKKTIGKRAEFDSGEPVGAWFTYQDPKQVELRVGISFVSVGKARENCLREAASVSFDEARSAAKNAWNRRLSAIQIESKDRSELVKFYTALYHTMLQPVDKSGENSLWKSQAPYYDDFYCIWDTYRTSHPLLTLIAPDQETRMVNSLIDIYKHEGFLPDGRSGDCNGRTQGGSNGEMVVADALLKGLSGIDYNEAMEAMLKDAEVSPGAYARIHGRGGLEEYNTLGYISTNYERGGTKTVEYSANDWAIALCARKLGMQNLYDKYAQRSGNWENLWRPLTFDGVEGFIMPRRADGSWDDTYKDPTWEYYTDTPEYKLGITPYHQIPDESRRDDSFTPLTFGSWAMFFYESHSWEYSFYVPHDVKRLIEKCGGTEAFLRRLDIFFDKGYYNINNEPSFLVPCLYIYAGRHDKSVERIHGLLNRYYTDRPDGLPGNDDSGAMSSWYVFHTLGLFPNAGQDVYLITAPRFAHSVVDLGNGHKLSIKVEGLSKDNIYVKSVELNGKKWNKAWLRHDDIANGGELRFVMSKKPVQWDNGVLPPSRSDEWGK